jgi:hypothetical protein
MGERRVVSRKAFFAVAGIGSAFAKPTARQALWDGWHPQVSHAFRTQRSRFQAPFSCSPAPPGSWLLAPDSWLLAPDSATAYCLLLTAYCLLLTAYRLLCPPLGRYTKHSAPPESTAAPTRAAPSFSTAFCDLKFWTPITNAPVTTTKPSP